MINESYTYSAVVPGTVVQVAGRIAAHYGGTVSAGDEATVVDATRGSDLISFTSIFEVVPFLGLLSVLAQKWCHHRVRVTIAPKVDGQVAVDWCIRVKGGASYFGTTPPLVRECHQLESSLRRLDKD